MSRRSLWALGLLVGLPIAVFSVWALVDNPRLYLITLLNSLTLASLYFIVASGFTLVFGLMRNVNLAHGSLYLLGGYVAFIVAERTGWWVLAIAAGFLAAAVAWPRRPRQPRRSQAPDTIAAPPCARPADRRRGV